MGGGTPGRLARPHAARPWPARRTERLGCGNPMPRCTPELRAAHTRCPPPTVTGHAGRGNAVTDQPRDSSSSDDSATWAETTASRSSACRSRYAKKAGDLLHGAARTQETQTRRQNARARLHSPARRISASVHPDNRKSWPRRACCPRHRAARRRAVASACPLLKSCARYSPESVTPSALR